MEFVQRSMIEILIQYDELLMNYWSIVMIFKMRWYSYSYQIYPVFLKIIFNYICIGSLQLHKMYLFLPLFLLFNHQVVFDPLRLHEL